LLLAAGPFVSIYIGKQLRLRAELKGQMTNARLEIHPEEVIRNT
jgi:hypothetical protein